MDIMTLIQAVPGVGPFLPYVLIALGICAVLAAQIPPPKQADTLYGFIYRIVNLLGQNYNQARNANAAPASPSKTAVPPTAALVLIATLALPIALGACSGSGSSPAADVAALEASLTAAEDAATAYSKLPTCTETNGPLCSDSAVVTQIKSADTQAYTLVKAAELAADDGSAMSDAQAAVAALVLIINSLPKQGS
jgi:hypothetical protein